MKYFYVYAETTLPVFSDGTVDCDCEHAQDNITKYHVDEWNDENYIDNTKEYSVEDFDKIALDHPAPEWQNDMW